MRDSWYVRVAPVSGTSCDDCTTIRSVFDTQYCVFADSADKLTIQQSKEPAGVISFSSPVTRIPAGIDDVLPRALTMSQVESRQFGAAIGSPRSATSKWAAVT